MKNKKLLNIIGGVLLSGCVAFKPGGSIDIAYVPDRCDDKPMTNELKIGLESYVNTEFDNFKIKTGGKATTYMHFPSSGDSTVGGFDPTRISFDVYSQLSIEDLTFYIFHNCTHPIKDTEYWIYQKNKEPRIINHDSLTEIGVRWEF